MTESEPPSPCNNVCQLDPDTGWCRGCRRSGDEIAAWPGLNAAGKRALLVEIGRRRQSLLPSPHGKL
jgi:predicted Fe-S protein YdhL (DUF1289 family)